MVLVEELVSALVVEVGLECTRLASHPLVVAESCFAVDGVFEALEGGWAAAGRRRASSRHRCSRHASR